MNEDLAAWLAFDALKGISHYRKVTLLESLSLSELRQRAAMGKVTGWSSTSQEQMLNPEPALLEPVYTWLAQSAHHHVLTLDDARYPKQLKAIADPPLLLFVAGDIECLSKSAVAIVGSRNASHPGREIACAWAKQLADIGLVVVSGLAEGIDAAAHWGALDGGTTIAVQGCGLNHCYPLRHQKLCRQIE